MLSVVNRLYLAGLIVFLVSCQNTISGDAYQNQEDKSNQPPTGLQKFKGFECRQDAESIPSPALNKLTKTELSNRIQALTEHLPSRQNVAYRWFEYLVSESVIDGIPEESSNYYARISTSSGISAQRAQAMLNVAEKMADYVMDFANTNTTSGRRRDFIGACAQPALPLSSDCARSYIEKMWAYVGAGSADPQKVSTCMDFFTEHENQGMFACFTYLLASPEFNYSKELGDNEGQLSDIELARKLARVFWMRPPDDQLLAWAQASEIKNRYEEVLEYVFSNAYFEEAMQSYFQGYLRLNEVRTVDFASSSAVGERLERMNLQELENVTNYHEYAVQEALDYSSEKLRSGASFSEYLTSSSSYAQGPVAIAYGLASWEPGMAPQEHPAGQRSGALTLAALHLNDAVHKSHFHLGYQILKTFLCRTTPPLGEDGLAAAAEPYPEPDGLENSVSRAERMTSAPQCMSCHSSFNSLGFALGNIGPWGEFMNQEPVFTDDDPAFRGWAEVGSQQTHNFFGGQLTATSSAPEFGNALLQTNLPQACFSQNFFRWAFGREEDLNSQDACVLQDIFEGFIGGKLSMKESMKKLAQSKAFMNRQVEGNN